MDNYLITVTTVDGQIRVVKPSEYFRPFQRNKRSKINNAKALMIDIAKSVYGKKIPIVSGVLTNLHTEEELTLIELKDGSKKKK